MKATVVEKTNPQYESVIREIDQMENVESKSSLQPSEDNGFGLTLIIDDGGSRPRTDVG